MGIVQRFQHWSHHTREDLTSNREDLTSTVLRVILGVILLAKGIAFLSNADELRSMIMNSRFSAGTTFLVSYVTFAHIFGGVFIIVGLLTRFVLLLQLPILIGALVFILPAQGISAFNGAFFLTLLVLILLIYSLVVGPGEISMDDYMKKHLLQDFRLWASDWTKHLNNCQESYFDSKVLPLSQAGNELLKLQVVNTAGQIIKKQAVASAGYTQLSLDGLVQGQYYLVVKNNPQNT